MTDVELDALRRWIDDAHLEVQRAAEDLRLAQRAGDTEAVYDALDRMMSASARSKRVTTKAVDALMDRVRRL